MQATRCKLKNKFFEKFPLPSEGEGQVRGRKQKRNKISLNWEEVRKTGYVFQ
jgi:hypothetical protein